MINPKELMFGNYVQGLYEVEQVTEIQNILVHTKCTKSRGGNVYLADDLQPIEINPEWLERLGFNVVDFSDTYENKLMGFRQCDKGWELCFLSETNIEDEDIYYHYVHQIQNAYFALTKKELTLGGAK